MKIDLNDTITAVATSCGDSGIGIVRISGKLSLPIADKVFLAKSAKKPSCFKTFTTHYGWIIKENLKEGGEPNPSNIIDEVILTVMRAPRSYTCEDVVEISCHGGIIAQRAILDLVLENGARLASPGEFTRRAFLNGRIDLSQAEAVLDITKAKTDRALKIGIQQLKGVLSLRLNKIREKLLDALSCFEANIDFPDEDIPKKQEDLIKDSLSCLHNDIEEILSGANYGKIFREGINTVICGKTNVGKSSLLNALLKQERSIVTPIAGTTRDVIEEVIDIQGIPIRIMDTAGIIKPRDLVEKKAIARTNISIGLADLVILMFDGSRRLSVEDEILIKKLKKKNVVAIINKSDLPQRIEKNKLLKIFSNAIEISAKKLKKINILEQAIVNLVYKGKITPQESIYISNARHIQQLKRVQKSIAQALQSIDSKVSIEFVAQDIKDAIAYLDDLLGRSFSEDLLDRIFSRFCIGK